MALCMTALVIFVPSALYVNTNTRDRTTCKGKADNIQSVLTNDANYMPGMFEFIMLTRTKMTLNFAKSYRSGRREAIVDVADGHDLIWAPSILLFLALASRKPITHALPFWLLLAHEMPIPAHYRPISLRAFVRIDDTFLLIPLYWFCLLRKGIPAPSSFFISCPAHGVSRPFFILGGL